MGGPRNAAYIWTIVALALLAGASIVPTPFYLLAPGNAVELGQHVAVGSHPAPSRRFYLTDVAVARASLLLLAGALVPGTRIVRREDVVPSGATARTYDRALVDAMTDSQNVAAIVAERSAGYRIALPQRRFVVSGFVAGSRARRSLRDGDAVLAVAGRPVRALDTVANYVGGLVAGSDVRVTIARGPSVRNVVITTMANDGETRLGIFLRERLATVRLPVPVRFDVGAISGSSGGLMFALEIYATLHGGVMGEPVAGTGTISADGTVGRIEGTRQKFIAAERAGARLFLVPRANYGEVAADRHIRVVAVDRFDDALRATGLSR